MKVPWAARVARTHGMMWCYPQKLVESHPNPIIISPVVFEVCHSITAPSSLSRIYIYIRLSCCCNAIRSTKRGNEITDQISVSVLEIYCEQIRDLLSDNVSSATFIYI